MPPNTYLFTGVYSRLPPPPHKAHSYIQTAWGEGTTTARDVNGWDRDVDNFCRDETFVCLKTVSTVHQDLRLRPQCRHSVCRSHPSQLVVTCRLHTRVIWIFYVQELLSSVLVLLQFLDPCAGTLYRQPLKSWSLQPEQFRRPLKTTLRVQPS